MALARSRRERRSPPPRGDFVTEQVVRKKQKVKLEALCTDSLEDMLPLANDADCQAAAAAEAAAAVKAAVEAGKKQRLEAATAAKLRGEPFAECSWREGGRQHEDARRARASLDAHRAAVAQMNETRQSSGSFEWRQPEKQQSRRGGSKLDCSTRAASSARRRPRPPPRPRSRRLPRPPPWWCCSHSGRGCTASSRAATPAAPSGQSRGSALRACCVLLKGSDESLKLNTHTIPASGFRASDFFKARRVCGSNGGHTR